MTRPLLPLGLGLLTAVLAFPVFAEEAAVAVAPVPLPDADAFYARVRERHAPMFARYAGTETKTRQEIVRRHTKTGEVKDRIKLVLLVRDRFYAPREVEALEYWKNGEKLDPSEYKDRGSKEPRHPLLDANAPKHYRVKVLGREKKAGHDCVVLRFIAREKTESHLEGKAWFDEESLDLVRVDMQPADLPFGIQEISGEYYFRQQGDLMVPAGGLTRVMIHVPLVFPNNLMVIRDEPISVRGLPR